MSTLDLPKKVALPIKDGAPYFGLTEKACRVKISTGVWVEGKHYTRPKGGVIQLVISEIQNWQLGNGR
jgi:hypothetical protein